MGYKGEPPAQMGPAMSPGQVIRALRHASGLKSGELVETIKIGAAKSGEYWPELSQSDIAEMRRQASLLTNSRIRAWQSSDDRAAKPTWLIVRALISGLHDVLE